MRALTTDPLRSFKFRVTIAGTSPVPSTIAQLGFMNADGLGMQNSVIPYREGGDNTTSLPLDAPILTTTGWKPLSEIEVGDRLVDPYGHDSKVVDLLPIQEKDTYRLRLGDGTEAVACWGHLWEVEIRDSNNRLRTEVLSTLQVKELVDKRFGDGSAHFHVRVPRNTPMHFDVAPVLPVDPYLLGVLLAEGSLEADGVSFAQEEDNTEVIERCRRALPEGHSLRPEYQDGKIHSWAITVGNDGAGARNICGRNAVLQAIRDLGLCGHRAWEKFIPEQYLWASVEDRVALLQGLMDGDGWVDERHCAQFGSSSQRLTEDVVHLIRSLGGRVGKITHSTGRTYTYQGANRSARDFWSFAGISDLPFAPFTLSRKLDRWALSSKTSSQFRRIVAVDYEGAQEVRCVEVSAPSHLFIAYAFIPTHNTRKMPGQTDFGPITLSRGAMSFPMQISSGGLPGDGTNEVYKWFGQVFSAVEGQGTGTVTDNFRSHLTIDVLEHPDTSWTGGAGPHSGGVTVLPIKMRFYVFNAWPMGLSWSNLDAGAEALFIESLQLAHEGFVVKYSANTPGSFVNGSWNPSDG